jgi:hypothetical protein
MKRVLSASFILILATAAGCGSPAASQTDPSAAGQVAAAKVELKILDYDGIQALIKSHQGKVVVVDCWSTT